MIIPARNTITLKRGYIANVWQVVGFVSMLMLAAAASDAVASSAAAADPKQLAQLHFSDPEKQRRFVELKAELRCPM